MLDAKSFTSEIVSVVKKIISCVIDVAFFEFVGKSFLLQQVP